jgi:alpha-beta hydrolase superfamily lysophospholipase
MESYDEGIRVLTASDETGLPYRVFPADAGTARGSLVYVHGIQSHGGWYLETAAELAGRGWTVYLPDRRGSGVSRQRRGWFPSRAQLVDDLRRFVELARREQEGPVVIVGGCWGARPAVTYALAAQESLAGLVLICPALKSKLDLSLREKLAVLAFGRLRPFRPVRIPLEPHHFTRNPRWLDYVRNDPLSLHHVTASFFFQQALWDLWLRRRTELRLPLLLLQSGRDEVVDIDGVRAWFDRQEAWDKRYVLYAGFDHILDFEDGRKRYWDDLSRWLDTVTAPRRAQRPAT